MIEFFKKLKLTIRYIKKVGFELLLDLYLYYSSPFPILLIFGALRRIRRRLKCLWMPKGRGRPAIPENIVDLILDMKRSNLLWGSKRIRDELLYLGICLHKRTIQRILKENGFTMPPMKFSSPTWKSLLSTSKITWAMDFTCIIDIKSFQIFVLVVIDTSTRKLVSINTTLFPDKNWIIQQFRNMAVEGVELPHQMVVDNDGIYGNWLNQTFKDYYEINILRTARGSLWQNAFVERFHRALKEEMLNRILILNEWQIRSLCQKYKKYYNDVRPHQGICGQVPSQKRKFHPKKELASIKYQKVRHLDGLFTQFQIAA